MAASSGRFLNCCCSRIKPGKPRAEENGLDDYLGVPTSFITGGDYFQMTDEKPAEQDSPPPEPPAKDPPQTMWSVLREELLYIVIFFIVGYCFYGFHSDWSAVDCIYFSVVIVTSVGYGDLVPKTEIEMLFTAAYILAAMVIVISAISRIVDIFVSGQVVAAMKKSEEAKEQELHRMCHQQRENSDGSSEDLFASKEKQAHLERRKQIISCLKAFAMLCIWGAVGTLFFSTQKEFTDQDNLKEIRPWIGALYFTVVTLTTVGFGDDAPQTDLQKAFSVLFILVGVPLFGAALTEFTALLKGEDVAEEQALNMITSLDEGKVNSLMEFEKELNAACGQHDNEEVSNGEIDRFEYTAFILVKNGAIKMEALQEIMSSFNKLDVDGSGSISKDDLPASFGS